MARTKPIRKAPKKRQPAAATGVVAKVAKKVSAAKLQPMTAIVVTYKNSRYAGAYNCGYLVPSADVPEKLTPEYAKSLETLPDIMHFDDVPDEKLGGSLGSGDALESRLLKDGVVLTKVVTVVVPTDDM